MSDSFKRWQQFSRELHCIKKSYKHSSFLILMLCISFSLRELQETGAFSIHDLLPDSPHVVQYAIVKGEIEGRSGESNDSTRSISLLPSRSIALVFLLVLKLPEHSRCDLLFNYGQQCFDSFVE